MCMRDMLEFARRMHGLEAPLAATASSCFAARGGPRQGRRLGRREGMPAEALHMLDETERATAHGRGMHLVLALNYGARAEITDAVRAIATQVPQGTPDPTATPTATLHEPPGTARLAATRPPNHPPGPGGFMVMPVLRIDETGKGNGAKRGPAGPRLGEGIAQDEPPEGERA